MLNAPKKSKIKQGRRSAPHFTRLTLPVLPAPKNKQPGPYTGNKVSEALDMADVENQGEKAEGKILQKTPEAAAVSSVIGGQPNQEIHDAAKAAAHANDRTLSEPDMIAMEKDETVAQYKARVAQIQANRFGFYDPSKSGSGEADKQLIAQASTDQIATKTNPPHGFGQDGRWHFKIRN
ncbi:MAG: hypothetical protein IT342_09860 [Candidatus Melainabacteria bacterium]|nr:hypothetical protein [Candidatus Melainabacteria bacterium]